jgi:thioredoxin 1
MVDEQPIDDELLRLREKKIREMEREMAIRAEGAVRNVTDATFQGFIQNNSRVLIDFWAEWCGPCSTLAPVVEDLAAEFAGRVAVGKCDTDENPVISRSLQISAIPTLLLFSHGQLVDRIIGAYPEESIRTRIMRAFF